MLIPLKKLEKQQKNNCNQLELIKILIELNSRKCEKFKFCHCIVVVTSQMWICDYTRLSFLCLI